MGNKWEEQVKVSLDDIFGESNNEDSQSNEESEILEEVETENEEYIDFVKDLYEHYSEAERTDLEKFKIPLSFAKEYFIKTEKKPIWNGRITNKFRDWMKKNHSELTEVLSHDNEESKEEEKEQIITLTSKEIKEKIKESKMMKHLINEKVDPFGEEKKEPTPYLSDHVIESKKEIIEREKSFSYSEHPIIALIWGYDSTSKSEQIMKFKPREKTLIFDLEDKLRPQAAKMGFPQENIINAKKYNERFNVSGPATLQGIRDIIEEIKKCKIEKSGKFKDVETIAFDGISDIRKPFAVLEWLKEHPERQKPMNWGDWGEINDKVKDICFTLINMGLVTNTNIFFTAQIDWKDDKEVPDCKPWIWYNVQHKFKMIRDDINKRFYAYCEKSYHDPFWTVDLTDWTHKDKPSLFNILQDPELVKKYIEEFKKAQSELAEKKLSSEAFGE